MATMVMDQTTMTRLAKAFGEDAVQDVLLKCLERGTVLVDPSNGSLLVHDDEAADDDHALARFWVTTRRQAGRRRDRVNTDSGRLDHFLMSATSAPTLAEIDQVDSAPLYGALRAALSALDGAAAACLVSFYIEGRSTKEIAAAAGVQLATARKRLQRAREALSENELLFGAFEQDRGAA